MSTQTKQKVLVSGASGFIASHIVKQLVEQGFYVVGTVRSDEKGEFLKKQYPSDFEYAIVKDIAVPGTFDKAFQDHPDTVYVLHTASPFTFNATSAEKDFLNPAINGTLSVLRSAKAYGKNVKKVVVTSSFAANMQTPFNKDDHDFVYSESVWNNITYDMANDDSNLLYAYVGSKTLAERAAWDFVESEKPDFVISTIQVPYVWGPPINDINASSINTSNQILQQILSLPKDSEPISDLVPYYIDVRDAAKTHLSAMTNSYFDNKRCLSIAGLAGGQLILDTMRKVRPDLQDKLAVGKPGTFDPKDYPKYDNSATVEHLGFKYYSFDQTIGDTIEWLIKEQAA